MRSRTLWRVAFLFFLVTFSSAWATSIFVEGVILEVKADGSGYTVKGYDHYNAKRYEDKITTIQVKIARNAVFTLDSRLVSRAVALVPGRAVYAIGSSAGAGLNVVLSEPSSRTIGQYVGLEGSQLKLKVVMGQDSFEQAIGLDGQVLFREEGKEASKEAILAAGKVLRVTPSRPQTLLVFSPGAVVEKTPEGFGGAAFGLLKDPAGEPKLVVFKQGKAEEFAPDGKKMCKVYDICGDVCHGNVPKPVLTPGWPAVVAGWIKRPGKVDWYLMVQAADPGRIEGVVKSFEAGKLVLSILALEGVREESLTMEVGAAVKLDNKETPAAEALKPGHYVSFFPARPQTIEAILWPAPAHK